MHYAIVFSPFYKIIAEWYLALVIQRFKCLFTRPTCHRTVLEILSHMHIILTSAYLAFIVKSIKCYNDLNDKHAVNLSRQVDIIYID